ncbi:LamG-like jellyroll fold domain-containing protein [Kitasatospora sp. NPDC094015]|uniref:LamG-like jellyroll fold domain-containing protein n=1 Tax=Kitasatospora sp. NPDC094015 TaxID=3155205 RepID=UPI00331999A8
MAAVAEAKRTGKPVEVVSKRTETADVVAQPDGRLLATTYVQPHRVRRAGGWVDIDPVLSVRADGSVAPKAATADVVFSGGGSSQPLVRIASRGKELKLSWPKALPKPVVEGSTAEYRSILPEVDLRLTATRTGFSQIIVVHSAEAAKNPELDQLRLGLAGEGLKVGQAADGSLSAVDRSGGGTVFEAPTPVMWDSSRPVAGAPGASALTSPTARSAPASKAKNLLAPAAPATAQTSGDPLDGLVPGDGAKVARIKVDLPAAQDKLVLTPDQAMLDDPGTVFPVMIDPAWNTPSAADWAGVSRYYASQAYWHFTYNSTYVHDWGVGYCGDTSRCAPADVKRAFFQIPTSTFVGKQILSAEFGTYESHSWSCSPSNIELWSTGWVSSGTNWNSQNASGFWSRKLQTMSAAKGWSGSCPGGWLEFGGTSGGVKDLVQDAANWGWSWTTFGLKAENEGDSNSWKRLTDDAFLRVYYNLPPRQTPMNQLTMSPGSVCSSTGVGINNWPQITATASDPDGEAVGVQFAVAWDDGSSGYKRRWWSTGSEGAAPNGNSFKGSGSLFSVSLPTLPASVGGSYGWEMRAWDGASWGPWSSDGDPTVCYFNVDTTRPEGPKVTSSSYPGSTDAAAALPWTDGVGKYGDFTVSSTATDVVKYQWGLDSGASAAHEVATAGGAARTIKLLPQTPGVHLLAVQAVDGVGNVSESQSYYFNVLNGQPQRTGWALDETGGSSYAGGGGSVPLALRPGATAGAPGHQGSAVAFNGTSDGYAGTEGAVLDTDRSFSVSVWANLADISLTRTAVSQSAGNTAFFDLGERNGKWAFTTYTADLADGFGWQPAIGTAPAALNTWTHLTGVYDAAGAKVLLYVDGALAAQAPAPKSFASRGPLELGRFRYMGGYVDPWKGSLDELKVWDRALSATEVADSAADRPLTTGLPAKAVWHLDESAAPAVGLPESDPLIASGGVQAGVPGTAAKALHFDGTSGYARTARPQVDGTRNFSVAAWVRLPAPAAGDTTAKMAVTQNGQHNNEFSLYYSAYGKKWIFGRYKEDTSADTLVRAAQADCAPGTSVNGVPCFSGTDNQWVHLLGVSDAVARKTRLYINGFLVGEADYTQTAPWANPGPLQVGAVNREGVNAEFFGGDVDDVRVYDRVVTGSEAADLVVQRPQLAGRWKLDTASGSPTASPGEGPAPRGAVLNGGATINAAGGLYLDQGTLQLNGSTAYAATATAPVHTNQSFTLAGWATMAGSPTRNMTVLSQGGTTGDAVTVRWHYLKDDPTTGEHLGEWQAVLSGTDAAGTAQTVVVHSQDPTVPENWAHLTVVYDALSSRLSLYVNGNLENQACTTGATDCTGRTSWAQAIRPFDATGGLQLGRGRSAGTFGEYFSGELDDVWAFQGVLSSAQIVRLADYGTELDSTTGP